MVSAETVSWLFRGGSSRLMAGRSPSAPPAGGENQRLLLFFFGALGVGHHGDGRSMRTGCSCTSFSCLATTCSVRSACATSPTLRSWRAV